MTAVMICTGLAGRMLTRTGQLPPVGQYLASYDPEAHNGQGEVTWTADLALAMRFADKVAAFACWRQVPRNRRKRPDGQPNRPLTAFTVTLADLDPATGRPR